MLDLETSKVLNCLCQIEVSFGKFQESLELLAPICFVFFQIVVSQISTEEVAKLASHQSQKSHNDEDQIKI